MSDESIRTGWFSPAKDNTSLSGSGSEILWSSRCYKENKEYTISIIIFLLSCAVVKKHFVGGP